MIDVKAVIVAMAVVAVAGCASGSGGVKPATAQPPAVGVAAVTSPANLRVRFNRILVNADCTATVDYDVMVGKPGKKIGWLVEDAGCDASANWHIELVFETPWNNGRDRTVKIDRDDFRDVKVHPNTPPTPPGAGNGHKYSVWLVYPKFWGDDVRYELIDPELDIAM
jgi:hypothetical protein